MPKARDLFHVVIVVESPHYNQLPVTRSQINPKNSLIIYFYFKKN